MKKMKKIFKNLSRFIQRNFPEVFAIGLLTDNCFSQFLSDVEIVSLLLMLNLSRKIDMLERKINCFREASGGVKKNDKKCAN